MSGMVGDAELFAMHREGGDIAVALFGNQGMHAAARAFGLAHERAAQYLAQAPVMVFAAGVGADQRTSALYMQHRLRSQCEQGVSLKVMMRGFGYPLPLRRLKASALIPSVAPALPWLAKTSPSVLGRVIPEKTTAQRKWLSELCSWIIHFKRHGTLPSQQHFDWMAERLAVHAPEKGVGGDIADFMIAASRDVGYAHFNIVWSWARAREEMTLWHDRLTCDRMLLGTPFGRETTIDLGFHPDNLAAMNFEFIALRTPSDIAQEGAAMKHCVASYIPRVIAGDCHIVSIRKNGERAATLELSRAWDVRQLKRRFNRPPSKTEESAARFYSELLKAKSKAKAA